MERTHGGNVLVTGGTGFVGSHLVELLLRKEYSVSCLVRKPSHLRWLNGQKVRIVQGDCAVPDSLYRAVQGVSVVYHLAGLTKARRVRDYYDVNHYGTRNLLEACGRHNPGLKKFVLVSSLAASGPSPADHRLTEGEAPHPVSDYGWSKLRAEEETLRWREHFPVVILRPSAVYGPRDRDMYQLFLWAKRGLTLEISGGERYITPCYVKDLAEAIERTAEVETPSGSTFFVAEERAYSWKEFRQLLLATGGVQAKTMKVPYWFAYLIGAASEFAGLFTGEAPITNRQKVKEAAERFWVCNPGKIREELDFTTRYPLEEGLKITWAWYREQGWL